MTEKLTSGDFFPQITLNIAGGDALALPESLSTPLTVVLFYRGYW